MFCGSLYSAVQKSPIAVEGCRATCEICPELWLLWLLCMAMTFAIVYGSKSEFADVVRKASIKSFVIVILCVVYCDVKIMIG